ncbi:MAG: hypothetical protein AB1351_05050 [Thermoproteota archaeon]
MIQEGALLFPLPERVHIGIDMAAAAMIIIISLLLPLSQIALLNKK